MYSALITILLILGMLVPASIYGSPVVQGSLIFMITTRGGLQSPVGVQEDGYRNNYQFDRIDSLFESCPPEIVIFVHGWGVGPEAAKEQLDRVRMSLNESSYDIPLIGYSWGSNIEWNEAKLLSNKEGAKLAHFISAYNQVCNSDERKSEVRLIGHSLGSRVVLSSLQNLNSRIPENNFKILSVNLMGAAVDNEEVSMDPIDSCNNPFTWWIGDCALDPGNVKRNYGNAINQHVVRFYNLVNSEDNVLEFIYPAFEGGDRALGQDGKQQLPHINTPQNYLDINDGSVEVEIPAINDADGIGGCDIGICNLGFLRAGLGDNHLGYMGVRDLQNPDLLEYDGVINLVVESWRSDGN
jgi:hypothetical protein